jgi:NEDD8-activating enzyme E1 regulatory subunit
MQMSIDDFISTKSSTIDEASLVIACDIRNKQAVSLSLLVEHMNVPLIILRSYGMLGYMRLYKRECLIAEAKEFAVNTRDLRIATPWPELLELANSFKLDEMTKLENTHTPYVIILIQLC